MVLQFASRGSAMLRKVSFVLSIDDDRPGLMGWPLWFVE